MFLFSSTFYIITVALQAICVIHCIRKGTQQNWIWLIVFLPLIGCIVYFFSEIFTGRQIHSVRSGVSEIISPSGSIKKLEEAVRFSDSFANRVALADAYFTSGQTTKAIEIYESGLTGAFAENSDVIAKLITAYYREKRYDNVIMMGKRIYNQPQFPRSKSHVLYAMSLAYTGNNTQAENEFMLMKGRFSNFEARYYYSMFLQNNNRNDEARQLLREITDEVSQLSSVEKRYNREWINLAKDSLKRMS
jgi:hypothetical protein